MIFTKRDFMKFREFGFSMIEIMMAMALMAGLALAGMQLMKNQSKAQKTVEKKYETVTVLSDMRSVLSVPDNCTETFRNFDPASGVPTALKKKINGSFQNVYEIQKMLPGNIKVESYVLDKSLPNLATNETVLRINFNIGKAAIKEQVQNLLKLTYNLDPVTFLISDCVAINNNSDTLWLKSLLDPHNIFYISGYVGVGTSSPTAMLDVTGSVKIGGTLKLNGSATAIPCSSSNEGEMRYDSSSRRMMYCNGTKWSSAGGTLFKQLPVALDCSSLGNIDMTYLACPPDMYVRSCGIEMTATPPDAPDTYSCSVDTVLNGCVGYRHREGSLCDPGINLQCFCQ
jgi:prepilin-type N-terminal cleavage/methylation domain-containing protein